VTIESGSETETRLVNLTVIYQPKLEEENDQKLQGSKDDDTQPESQN